MVEQAAKPTIGWIGTGVMGKSMAMHLKNKGYKLLVHTRSAAKAQELVAAGATMESPKTIAEQADFLFLMLGFPHDVKSVVLDEENGIL